MRYLLDVPLRQKLMGSILLTSVVVMLLIQAAYFSYDLFALQRATIRYVSTLGEITAANSTAALAFQNQRDAQEILDALKAERHIVAAAIYDRDGRIFSHYPQNLPTSGFPSEPDETRYHFSGSDLKSFQAITQRDRRLGTLFLQFDLDAVKLEWLWGSLRIAFGVMVITLLVAYILSRALQKQISRPILALANAAKDISMRQDFSVRATKYGRDEIGDLADRFNEMLAGIQQRDAALHAANGALRTENAERKRAEEKAAWLASFPERNPSPIVELDLVGQDIHYASPCTVALFPDLFERGIHHPLLEGLQTSALALLDGTLTLQREIRVGDFFFSQILNYIPETRRLRAYSTDITERKRAEESLQIAKDDLDRKVTERTAELRIAKEQAESSDRMKSEFLATMSHELRTPLNAIIGFTGTLLMRLPGPLTKDQEKQLTTIQTSARHLLSLINDLLDIAKIESGKFTLKLEQTVFNNVIEEMAMTLRPAAERKGLEFDVKIPEENIVLRTDRRALNQIVINLTNNAIKYTESGKVAVELLRRQDLEGMHVEISVHDTGSGVRPQDQSKLFQAFSQLDSSSTRQFEGTGLGLHLSQKLAELIGAHIKFQSEYGKGSVFTLSMMES